MKFKITNEGEKSISASINGADPVTINPHGEHTAESESTTGSVSLSEIEAPAAEAEEGDESED